MRYYFLFLLLLSLPAHSQKNSIFQDGFESGNASNWSNAVGEEEAVGKVSLQIEKPGNSLFRFTVSGIYNLQYAKLVNRTRDGNLQVLHNFGTVNGTISLNKNCPCDFGMLVKPKGMHNEFLLIGGGEF